jgi:hypothetical protein
VRSASNRPDGAAGIVGPPAPSIRWTLLPFAFGLLSLAAIAIFVLPNSGAETPPGLGDAGASHAAIATANPNVSPSPAAPTFAPTPEPTAKPEPILSGTVEISGAINETIDIEITPPDEFFCEWSPPTLDDRDGAPWVYYFEGRTSGGEAYAFGVALTDSSFGEDIPHIYFSLDNYSDAHWLMKSYLTDTSLSVIRTEDVAFEFKGSQTNVYDKSIRIKGSVQCDQRVRAVTPVQLLQVKLVLGI